MEWCLVGSSWGVGGHRGSLAHGRQCFRQLALGFLRRLISHDSVDGRRMIIGWWWWLEVSRSGHDVLLVIVMGITIIKGKTGVTE